MRGKGLYFNQLSEEVSVDACGRPNHITRQNTRTPARAILGGQEEQGTVGSMRCMTASSGLIFCGGHGKKYAETVGSAWNGWRDPSKKWTREGSGTVSYQIEQDLKEGNIDRDQCGGCTFQNHDADKGR